MLARTFAAIAVFVMLDSVLIAQEFVPTIKVGDRLSIRMTGDVAKEYARRSGRQTSTANGTRLVIETPATVTERLTDKHYRIEQSFPISLENKRQRLITLSAIIDPKKIVGSVDPGVIEYSSSPTSKEKFVIPASTRPDSQTRTIEISDLKDLKFQTWELVNE